MDIVLDKKDNVLGLQLQIQDTETAARITLSSIGTMTPYKGGKVVTRDLLEKPVQLLEVSTSGNSGVTALKLVQDGD